MNTTAEQATENRVPHWVHTEGRQLGDANDVVKEAFARDKRESLRLAVMARLIALGVIAVLLLFIVPPREVIYYEVLVAGFALIGWAQLKLGRVGQSRAELLLMFCDLALMTFVLVFPNPLRDYDWPTAMQFRFNNFIYFYVLLAGATLAYSWRTVFAVGTWTTGLWLTAVAMVVFLGDTLPELSDNVGQALTGHPLITELLDPNSVRLETRIQEVVVFILVAGILALSGWRSNRLLVGQVSVERERANLARYFSPNVVEELSQNDDPLKRIRTQNVAVLFVDIVGFTTLADERPAEQVIQILREFHGRMERQVFAHSGTLDKYLGDGLMATFGTPTSGPTDAGNALRCAFAMIEQVRMWNEERRAQGEAPIQAGFGIHYGQAVLGDIGANRLEFAVIGSTVNIASRLEALTRELGAQLVVSNALVEQARTEPDHHDADFDGLVKQPIQDIRGIAQPIAVWSLQRSPQSIAIS